TVISACINKRPIPIYGKGLNIRDWLHVTDHCRAIELIINKGNINETYNVGADNEWRNIDLAKLICQIMDELYPHDHSNIDLI
ncbi:NAD-dependent epimerase/dehydratase family protein, partial [Acinetobacter baumannii]